MPDDEIQDIESVLTLLGGKPVHASGAFAGMAPPLPPAMPDWSPVNRFGGYQRRTETQLDRHRFASACGCGAACGIHGHDHATALGARIPAQDEAALWGALGCSCWAF